MDKKFKHKKMHYGICIDIFCLWYLPKEEKQRKKLYKYINKLSSICYSSLGDRPEIKLKNIKQIIQYYKYSFLRKQTWLLKKFENNANKFGAIDNGEVYQVDKRKMPSKLINELYEVEFEGYMLPCPKNYHQYLTILYGDYMKLPDISERYGHKDIIVDVNKSFEEYR